MLPFTKSALVVSQVSAPGLFTGFHYRNLVKSSTALFATHFCQGLQKIDLPSDFWEPGGHDIHVSRKLVIVGHSGGNYTIRKPHEALNSPEFYVSLCGILKVSSRNMPTSKAGQPGRQAESSNPKCCKTPWTSPFIQGKRCLANSKNLIIAARWCPRSLAFSWFISPITTVYST